MAVNKVVYGTTVLVDLTADTVTAESLMQGYTAHDKSGALITGTATGGNDFVVTLSYNDQTEMWEPDCTYVEAYAAYQAGKNVVLACPSVLGVGGFEYNSEDTAFYYSVYGDYYHSDGSSPATAGVAWYGHVWSSSGLEADEPVLSYYAFMTDASPNDVASGKVFVNATGTQVGTSSGASRMVVAPQQTVTTGSSTTTPNHTAELDSVTGLVVGGIYVVTFDGDEYLFSAGKLWGGYVIGVGEQAFYTETSYGGYEIAPFFLFEVFNDITRTITVCTRDASSHVISVEQVLTDDLTVTNIVSQRTVTTSSSYTVTLSNVTNQLADGSYYLVTYDGTEYALTAAAVPNVSIGDRYAAYLHNDPDDCLYPLLVSSSGQTMTLMAIDANASHTIKVDRITDIPDSIALTTKTITANGTYSASDDDAYGYSSVTVNVSGGGGTYQAKTNINPTTSSQTITPDSGYDALSSVQINAMPSGTAGTPSATKGTVSNHSVSVTPSVTNTTGYITGGTKTGTAVTVSASELVSGSETKTANGTYDVTNIASLVVSIPIVTYHTSSSTPTSSQGSDGDLWLVTA